MIEVRFVIKPEDRVVKRPRGGAGAEGDFLFDGEPFWQREIRFALLSHFCGGLSFTRFYSFCGKISGRASGGLIWGCFFVIFFISI